MNCMACRAALPPGARFCGACGAPTSFLCPGCGTANPPGANFCIHCGATLARTGAVAPAAERRQITVLFCDLVGSTTLSSRLDPEDFRAVIGAYQAQVTEIAARFGGRVSGYLGDGTIVNFGWPQATEADAEQALRAALAVSQAIAREPVEGETLRTRIGIATGVVVIGEIPEAAAGQPDTAIGETPNRAARLQTLAEPGTIVIDAATRHLVGELFDIRSIGLVTLKGLPAPIEAFEVFDESFGQSRFEALRAGGSTSLVGREDELDLLERRWRQAREGRGRVVLLAGEAGIGKSRLLAELEKRLSGEALRTMRLFCLPHLTQTPLHPVIRYIGRDAGFGRDDPPAVRAKKLRVRLETTGASDEDFALIAALLGLPGDGLPARNLSPQRRKELTFAALLRRVETISARRPVLIFLEDVHWADPSTCELVDGLIRGTAERRVMLVMTFRPEFASSWVGHAGVTSLTLSRLERGQSVALAQELIAGRELPSPLVDRIVTQSDGVPLFIEELTKAVVERAPDAASAELQTIVPETLQASLLSRLDRIPAARQVAQVGSVFGREFRRTLLDQLAALPAPTLNEGLGQLAAAGLLFRRGEGAETVYRFKHALVQETAYNSLLRTRRATLHAAIGALLERNPETAVRPTLLAYHFAQAQDAERASLYFLRAGEASIANSAMNEAEAHVRQGLAWAAHLESPARRNCREAELTLALGNVRLAVKGIGSPSHRETFAKAAELCRPLDASDPGAARLLGRALFGRWSSELQAGELAASLRSGEELYALGRHSADPELRAAAYGYAASYLFLGRLEQARAILAAGIADDGIGAHRPATLDFGFDPACHLYAQYARSLALSGFPRQARAYLGIALERADGMHHLPTSALTMMIACTTAWILRDADALDRWSGDLMRVAAERGFSQWHARGLSYAGWLKAARGADAEGLAMLDRALLEFERMQVALSEPHTRAMRSDIQARVQPHLADAELDAALAVCARTGEVWPEAELHRRKGELHRSDPLAAEEHLRRAMAVARTQGALLFELRAAVSLARLRRERQPDAPVCDLLAPVCGRFSEGFEEPDLVEARALLGGGNHSGSAAA